MESKGEEVKEGGRDGRLVLVEVWREKGRKGWERENANILEYTHSYIHHAMKINVLIVFVCVKLFFCI